MRDPRWLRGSFWLGLSLAAGGVVWSLLPVRGGDVSYSPQVRRPAYGKRGPQMLIDEAHGNTHTARAHFTPLAKLFERDGFRVSRGRQTLFGELLEPYQVLVIANPRQSFSSLEISAIRAWVDEGGGLMLISDRGRAVDVVQPVAAVFGLALDSGAAEGIRLERPVSAHPVHSGRPAFDRPIRQLFLFPGPAVRGGPGAVELAARRVVAVEPGRGRVVVLAGAEAFSAREVNGELLGLNTPGADNAQFALNVAHWLSRLI